ncbi:hypothetical protein I4U23_022129 [Adineta vaga]|nr:hypothetical protein I4U23_022129 [Adineta vaga]
MLDANIVSDAFRITEELSLHATDIVVEHSRNSSMNSREISFLTSLELGDCQDEEELTLTINFYILCFPEETVDAFCKLFLKMFPIVYDSLKKFEQKHLKTNLFSELLEIPVDNVHGFLHENKWSPRRHYTASMLKILFERTEPSYHDITAKEEMYLMQQFKISEPNEWSAREKYESRSKVRSQLFALFRVFRDVGERYGFTDTKVFIKYLLDKKERNKKVHLTEAFRSVWRTTDSGTSIVGSFDSFLKDVISLPIEICPDHLLFTKSFKHRCMSQADDWFKANDDVLVNMSAVGNSITTTQSNTEDAMVEAKFLRKYPSTFQPDTYIVRPKNQTVTNKTGKANIHRPRSPHSPH